MSLAQKGLRSIFYDENGQALVEYALLLIVFVAVSYGMIKIFIYAWKKYFLLLCNKRTGVSGILP